MLAQPVNERSPKKIIRTMWFNLLGPNFCLFQLRKRERCTVTMLLYLMDSISDDIMLSFSLSDEQAGNYNVFKANFDAHFVKKRNVIMKEQSSICIFKEMTNWWICL